MSHDDEHRIWQSAGENGRLPIPLSETCSCLEACVSDPHQSVIWAPPFFYSKKVDWAPFHVVSLWDGLGGMTHRQTQKTSRS